MVLDISPTIGLLELDLAPGSGCNDCVDLKLEKSLGIDFDLVAIPITFVSHYHRFTRGYEQRTPVYESITIGVLTSGFPEVIISTRVE